jgi:hypothetical protein
MQLHARSGWVDKGMDMTPKFMKFLGFLMKFLHFLMKRHVKFKAPKKYGQHVVGKLVARNSGCSWGGLRKDFIPLPMYEGVYIKESWTTRLSDHLFDDPDLLWVNYSQLRDMLVTNTSFVDDAQEIGRALDGQTLCSLQLQSRMIHVYGTQSSVHTTKHDRGYALGENQSANPENQQGNPLWLRIVQFLKGPSLSLPDWTAAHSSSGLTGRNPDEDGGIPLQCLKGMR